MPHNERIIVAGGGRVGRTTARLLADHDHDVTIIERDQAVCRRVADEWFATVIEGDATNPEILEQAGVDAADAVAAMTGETGMNLGVCLAAERLAAPVRTVARIDSGAADPYLRFVDAAVFPERAGARIAASEILGSDVEAVDVGAGDLDLMQIRIEEGAAVAGKQLSEVNLPAGSLIISADGDRIVGPDATLEPGERYLVAVEPSVADEVMNLLRG